MCSSIRKESQPILGAATQLCVFGLELPVALLQVPQFLRAHATKMQLCLSPPLGLFTTPLLWFEIFEPLDLPNLKMLDMCYDNDHNYKPLATLLKCTQPQECILSLRLRVVNVAHLPQVKTASRRP